MHTSSPVYKVNDEVDAFFNAYGADTEKLSDINDAEPATLHITTAEIGGGAEQLSLTDAFNVGQVIGNQTMPPLDQCQGALTLTDTTFPTDQCPDSLDVEQSAVHVRAGRKFVFEKKRRFCRESLRLERRAYNRSLIRIRKFAEHLGRGKIPRNNHAGNFALQNFGHNGQLFGLRLFADKSHLSGTE